MDVDVVDRQKKLFRARRQLRGASLAGFAAHFAKEK
jgi:hypothetical protein